jgi:hypothetical protein
MESHVQDNAASEISSLWPAALPDKIAGHDRGCPSDLQGQPSRFTTTRWSLVLSQWTRLDEGRRVQRSLSWLHLLATYYTFGLWARPLGP